LFVGVSVGLVVVGFLASLVPALRAARYDPVKALQLD
jgi:ABC-type lipoprotein release transport system permease subunit